MGQVLHDSATTTAALRQAIWGLLSLNPIERGREAEDAGEADGGFVVAGGDGAPLLEARP